MKTLIPPPPQPLAPRPQDPPPTPEMREFGDPYALRSRIFDGVLDAASKVQPLSDARHTLRLSNVRYGDPDHVSRAEHKKATLTGDTVGRRLKGTWELADNATGAVVDRRDQVVAHVPYLTSLGTFVHRGSHYTLNHQQRLKAGVYARRTTTGELESHVNVLPGKGATHRYLFDPAKNVFKVRFGQSEVPLAPALQAMGVTPQALRDAWGPEVAAANMGASDPAAMHKLRDRLLRKADREGDEGSVSARVAEAFARMELDPVVTARTLGKPHDRLTPEAILAATSKLLKISRGEADVDDRDSPAYQTLMGPEDLFSERVARDHGGHQRLAFRKVSSAGSLSKMPSGVMTRQLHQALLGSGLGQAIEEVNPAETFDKQTRVSRLGEGGIPSLDSIPEEARNVQPGHYGFVDPLRTPESFKAGIDLHLARGARKGADGRLYAKFRNPRTRRDEWKSPEDLADATLAFPGWDRKTGGHVMAIKGGRLDYVRKRDVDYSLPAFEDAFSPMANLVPAKSSIKGQRVAMGSRFITQALALRGAEAPLVRGAVPGTGGARSYDEEYAGRMGAVHAEKPGTVVEAKNGLVRLRHDDGTTTEKELFDNYPFNRKSFLHQTPSVAPGQRVNRGDLLARSNYTDAKGVTALGLNARTAYMPWKGLNFEDAVVVSESMAKRLSSEHMYQHGIEVTDKHKLGKATHTAMFAGKYPREALESVDEKGVIRPGSTVRYGEPLILAAKQRELAEHKVHKQHQAGYADESVLWKHHDPGVVTDVAWGKDGPVVVVKSYSQAKVGDKLAGRYGDKGVISAVVPDHELPVGADGKPPELILNPLGVISRANPAQMAELWLGKVARHTGRPVNVPDFEDIPDMIAWAKSHLDAHGLKDTEDLVDPRGVKIPGVATGERFVMKLHHTAEGKAQGRGVGGYTADEAPAKGGETGCFTADTRLRLASGDELAIGAVVTGRLGSELSSRDVRRGDDVTGTVTDHFRRRVPASSLVKVTLENGLSFVATRGHWLYLADGSPTTAGDLRPGDDLLE